MIDNDRENRLKGPNSSKSLPNCPKIYQNAHFRRTVVRISSHRSHFPLLHLRLPTVATHCCGVNPRKTQILIDAIGHWSLATAHRWSSHFIILVGISSLKVYFQKQQLPLLVKRNQRPKRPKRPITLPSSKLFTIFFQARQLPSMLTYGTHEYRQQIYGHYPLALIPDVFWLIGLS